MKNDKIIVKGYPALPDDYQIQFKEYMESRASAFKNATPQQAAYDAYMKRNMTVLQMWADFNDIFEGHTHEFESVDDPYCSCGGRIERCKICLISKNQAYDKIIENFEKLKARASKAKGYEDEKND